MLRRILKPNNNNSLFLFGPRGCGKSTLAESFLADKNALKINFLTEVDEDRYGKNPDELIKVLSQKHYDWVLIDEVQKVPKILDLVHLAIERHKIKFFLTGSSARKLKRSSANLLAGRAFTYYLHPFTALELGPHFDLSHALAFGTLPKLQEYSSEEEKILYLNSYSKTYLTEEIIMEQAVRNIDLFKDFLQVAAQSSGKILNYSKIAKDIGSTDKTVKEYFQILLDTLLGFKLPSFHRSIRKSQREAPKFFLFDLGVKRALERHLKIPLVPSTYAYGEAFEQWLVLEVIKMNDYSGAEFKLSFLRTDDCEIDLVIERPGLADLLVEIKSSNRVLEEDAKTLNRFVKSWDKKVEAQLWSNDEITKKEGVVSCLHWREGLSKLFHL